LASAGLRVSLGHSMATLRKARAMEDGLTGFTHSPCHGRWRDASGSIAAAGIVRGMGGGWGSLIVDGSRGTGDAAGWRCAAPPRHPGDDCDARWAGPFRQSGCMEEIAAKEERVLVKEIWPGRCSTWRLGGAIMRFIVRIYVIAFEDAHLLRLHSASSGRASLGHIDLYLIPPARQSVWRRLRGRLCVIAPKEDKR